MNPIGVYMPNKKNILLKSPLWLLRGVAVGLCVGLAMTLFTNSISFVSSFRASHSWMLFFIPLGATLTAYVFHIAGHSLEKGTTLAIDVINEQINVALFPTRRENPAPESDVSERVPLRLAPIVFIFSVISHAVGASAGKEGGGVQIGTSIASGLIRFEKKLATWLHMDRAVEENQESLESQQRDKGLWLICGAGAAFGALFNAPVAGTVFGMQVASPRVNRLEALAPCLTASFISTYIASFAGIQYHHFLPVVDIASTPTNIFYLIIAAVCFGLFSRVFCWSGSRAKAIATHIGNPLARAGIVSTILLAMTGVEWFVLGATPFNGLGYELIDNAMHEAMNPAVPWLKLLFTVITLAAGFKGGEIVPILVCGSTLGSVLAPWLGLPVSTMAMCGALGMLSGSTKLPIVCFILGLEMFGVADPTVLFIVCAIGYLTSGGKGIYEKQIV